MDQALYQNHLGILREELLVALGCTEPIAIAYAGAKARQLLGVLPEHCRVRCSGNIIKNVKGVIVPNSGGMRGIDVAATLGIVGGDPDRELAVLETVTPADIQTTQALTRRARSKSKGLSWRMSGSQSVRANSRLLPLPRRAGSR